MSRTPVGVWRTFAHGWRVFLPVVLGEAAVQTALLASDPQPEASASFLALLAVSSAALLVAVWLTVAAASAAVDGDPRDALRRARHRPVLLTWALAVGVLAAATSLLVLWLAPIVLLFGAFVLPAVAVDDEGGLFARAVRPLVRTPLRAVLCVLAAIGLAAITWVVALVLGFFLTGLPAAALTWLWFGLVATFVICLWCSLYRRANPVGAEVVAPDGTLAPAT